MSFGWCSASIRARETRSGRGAFCHIVQLVGVMHRMWADAAEFRAGAVAA
jgi:hypothetical protein